MKSPGRGLYPNGSTELTLDNEGLRRKEKERETRDFGILPAGHPKQKRGAGCLWSGSVGRRGLEEERPYRCRGRDSADSEWGDSPGGSRQRERKGGGSPPVPCSPGMPHPNVAGTGAKSLLTAGEATSPQDTCVQTRKRVPLPPGRHGPLPAGGGACKQPDPPCTAA